MRRNTIDKVRENIRLQQVYNVFLRYGFDSLFDRWELLADFRHRMQRWVWHLPVDVEPLSQPVKLRLMLERPLPQPRFTGRPCPMARKWRSKSSDLISRPR
jgi:hypothetical protein